MVGSEGGRVSGLSLPSPPAFKNAAHPPRGSLFPTRYQERCQEGIDVQGNLLELVV